MFPNFRTINWRVFYISYCASIGYFCEVWKQLIFKLVRTSTTDAKRSGRPKMAVCPEIVI